MKGFKYKLLMENSSGWKTPPKKIFEKMQVMQQDKIQHISNSFTELINYSMKMLIRHINYLFIFLHLL